MPRLRAAAELDDDVLRSLLLALRHTVVGATGLTASFSDGIARAASAHLVAYYCDVTIDRRTQLGDGDFARLNDFITSRFTEGCTLESAACALGVSATRMTRLLKARTNQTFHQYVLQLRLECAFELLRNGQMNVTQAAMETCFGNLAHFSRTFSKHFGMPPSALKF